MTGDDIHQEIRGRLADDVNDDQTAAHLNDCGECRQWHRQLTQAIAIAPSLFTTDVDDGSVDDGSPPPADRCCLGKHGK